MAAPPPPTHEPACQAAFDGDVATLSALLDADPAAASAEGWVRAVPHAQLRPGVQAHGTGEGSVLLGLWTPGFESFFVQRVGADDAPKRGLPLQYAAWAGQVDAARVLIRAGASASACGGLGWSAAAIAACGRHEAMQALLGCSRRT